MRVPAAERTAMIAVVMGVAVTIAGATHFIAPAFFDEIVPPWLPPGPRFWTYTSGIAELIIGPALIWPRTRRRAGLAAAVLFVAVYPANIYMAWDWRDRGASDRIVSWVRLPLQFVFIWLAIRIYRTDVVPLSQPHDTTTPQTH
jgi:uncharacterized membrane protein